ncbi:transcription complex subunit [Aureococcus anophagefferens]|uniref:Transcription complex subunit n=1 Tax=Aureococcus anophagefferens TaxID=44056 RepID=A0ABR1FGU7_AURAN
MGEKSVEELYPLVLQLTVPDSPEHRESALLELSKKRETFTDLAPDLVAQPGPWARCSRRSLRRVAPETRGLFLNAPRAPLYLYPFLNTVSKNRPFEYLRLTSLGVVGALVKMDDSVINFLLQTEIIPLCLRIMETGSELSKTVATFIVQKILLDDMGLNYVCARRPAVLRRVHGPGEHGAHALVEQPSIRLLKHIVRCYLRLSDNLRAREALRQCLPESLRDHTFAGHIKDDLTVKRWLSSLLYNISEQAVIDAAGANNGSAGGAPLSG